MSEEVAEKPGLRQISPEQAQEIMSGKQQTESPQENSTEKSTQQPASQTTEAQPEQAEKKEEHTEQKAQETASAEAPETPEAKTEQPTPEQPQRSEELVAIENRIFEMTGGKTKDVNEFFKMTTDMSKKLEELQNQKPVVNGDLIMEYNKKLQEERGYDLQQAMKWRNLDIDSLSEAQKIDYALRVENKDRSEEWYNAQKKRLDLATMDTETLNEKIIDDEITAREVDKLKVERADLLHRSKKLLTEYKESFDINLNFETDNAAKAEQNRPDPEKVAEVRAALSKGISEVKTEVLDLDLPMELGKEQLEISYTDVEKNRVIETTSPDWTSKRYGKEDGTVDFYKMMRDRHRMLNFDSIMKRVAENSAVAAIKAYEKSRDNITLDKEKQTSPSQNNDKSAMVQGMKQFLQS